MASISGRDFMLVLQIITILIFGKVFSEDVDARSDKPCTDENFKKILLPCDINLQRSKAVYYMQTPCDLRNNKSIPFPSTINDIPCYCDPGEGKKSNVSMSCEKCAKGSFSHGGELIDDWSKWNSSTGSVVGHAYQADSYCSDFLTGKSCNSWKPSADRTFLISGNFKNSTELRCFEQSMLVMTRKFVRNESNNLISFDYKVDGAACRKGSSGSCSHGLYVFVNGKQYLKKDTQFHWKKMEIPNLKPGYNQIKFVYHKSCTREPVLDVAYIRHIAFIGTDAANILCTKCKKGTFSEKEGSSECKKCPPHTYQDEEGQTGCKICTLGYFSRIGAVKCSKLPVCRETDYYVLPNDIGMCTKNKDGIYYRTQTIGLPEWPGNAVCQNDTNTKIPGNPPVQCQCTPGWYLKETQKDGKSVVDCDQCGSGTYSDGKMMSCKNCPAGEAAVPGFYIDMFDHVPGLLKQNCSGLYCPPKGKDIWLPRGDYMANRRLPGDFEATLKIENIKIDYHEAKLSFNCSIDCRMEANGTRLAKHDHCFLKIVLQKLNKTSDMFESIREVDCVNKYRQKLRNGAIQQHEYPIKESGTYTFMVLFHQEDEANYSLVSYEARIYYADIYGAEDGSARGCTKCKPGTQLAKGGRYCTKCPVGTYNNDTANCIPCPENHFADEEGSSECTMCGNGTKANKNKDGCDYNGCKFTPAPGVMYDLSPLRRDGGSMYLVRTNRSRYYFPLYYYINICSLKHDNTSCYTQTRNVVTTGVVDKYPNKTPYKVNLLRTMACKRWSFDSQNSYSIGEVMSFKKWQDNVTNGLKIELHRGYKCWNKYHRTYQTPVTTILMQCDIAAGIGFPEPLDSKTGVDNRNCRFNILWRTYYACRICHEKSDHKEIVEACVDGKQTVTRIRRDDCRSENQRSNVVVFQRVCYASTTNNEEVKGTPSKRTPFIVAIVIAVLVIVLLCIFVVYYARRNRYLRGRLFAPGKAFSKVREEDEDELVDNVS